MADQASETTEMNGFAVVDVEVRENGPVVVVGPVSFDDGSGAVEVKRLFLCRCGGSAKSPMCDGSHKSNGFHAGGCEPPERT
jgi:CDGSH-type Zn-finger protein